MKHRISAGALVEHQGRLLLVRHQKPGAYDFWVAPGGGVIGAEELAATAVREVKEETGLDIVVQKLAYVEEFFNPHTRFCKFWFTARFVAGKLCTSSAEAAAEHIVEAAWFSPDQLNGLQVFPALVTERYWSDRALGFPTVHHAGLRSMAFW